MYNNLEDAVCRIGGLGSIATIAYFIVQATYCVIYPCSASRRSSSVLSALPPFAVDFNPPSVEDSEFAVGVGDNEMSDAVVDDPEPPGWNLCSHKAEKIIHYFLAKPWGEDKRTNWIDSR